MKQIKAFRHREDGAVSVDWVVLSAALAAMAAAIASQMEDGALGLATTLSNFMTNWTF